MKSGLWWKAGLGIGALLFLVWVIRFISTPPPGERMEDQGREHVTEAEVAEFSYNSNPPTSGPHLETWVKPGIFTIPQSEGQLIHSLEHGYVVIHYNCDAIGTSGLRDQKALRPITSLLPIVYAENSIDSTATQASEVRDATSSATGMNNTDGCKDLQKQLEDVASSKRLYKLMVVPRANLDTRVALTAWTYIDSFNEFDAVRIEKFIDYHRDHGPEQTME